MCFNNILYCFKGNITKEFTDNIVEFDDIIYAKMRFYISYIFVKCVSKHNCCFDSVLFVFELQHDIVNLIQKHRHDPHLYNIVYFYFLY